MIRLEAPALLLSDAHLTADAAARTALFASFLRGPARAARSVCILGDLFDAWTGDDDDSDFAETICAGLRGLTADVRVVVIRGNRDFLLGERFASRTGCEVLETDSVAAEIGGRRFLLAHGDHYLDDASYIRYRRWIRGGWFSALAGGLPGGLRMRLAKTMRRMSRGGRGDGKAPSGGFKFNRGLAELEMRRLGCGILAHGHFHFRLDEEWTGAEGESFRRVCLPDWTGESGAAGFAEADESGVLHMREWG